MNGPPEIVCGLSADGLRVTEAEVADIDGARALLAAARETGSRLAWAHSQADLSGLGYRRVPGYRRLVGRARRPGGAPDPDVTLLPGEQDSPGLWAAAYHGQWGHKTPGQWPLDLPAGTVTLCLRRDGEVAGLCRVEPQARLIDAPGLCPRDRDPDNYRRLLTAALAAVSAGTVTVESWGEPAELTAVAESLGLTSEEHVHGWELDLHIWRGSVR